MSHPEECLGSHIIVLMRIGGKNAINVILRAPGNSSRLLLLNPPVTPSCKLISAQELKVAFCEAMRHASRLQLLKMRRRESCENYLKVIGRGLLLCCVQTASANSHSLQFVVALKY